MVERAGQTVSAVKGKAKDLFSCPPGSECSRMRKEAKDAERYGVKYPKNGSYEEKKAARDEYVKAKKDEAEQNRALRKVQKEEYDASPSGQVRAEVVGAARSIGGVAKKSLPKVKLSGPVPAKRPVGRPRGSGPKQRAAAASGYPAQARVVRRGPANYNDELNRIDDEFSGLM